MLVAGGTGQGNGNLNSAEVFDPKTQTFRVTSMPMNTTHGSPTAVLLNDGRVLINGGDAATARVEIYDPLTDQFTLPAQPAVDHLLAPVVKLNDGRVLLAGGSDHQSTAGGAVEIYDPIANTWTLDGFLSQPRQNHGALLLTDGRVLVIGGFNFASPNMPPDTEIFDPIAKTSTIVTGARYTAPSPVQLLDGRAALINGNAFYTFDLAAQTFHQVGKTLPVNQPTPVLLPSGFVFVAGGHSASVFTLDPNTGTVSVLDTLSVARDLMSVAVLNDGSVLLIGGTGPLASAEVVRMPKRRSTRH